MNFEDMTPEQLDEVRAHLGVFVLNLPIASTAARHYSAESTLAGNYLALCESDPATLRAAKLYLKDVFTKETKEVLERWFPRAARDGIAAYVEAATAKWWNL